MTHPHANNAYTRIKLPILDPLPTGVIEAQAVQPPPLPGLHYVNNFDTSTVNNVYWPNLRKCQYNWIVVVGAGQYSEARDFARNVQTDAIRTNVIFRHWKSVMGSASDNGRMSVLTGAEWIDRVGSQHVNAPYWLMPDNEGLGAAVVKNSVDLIPRASSVKLKLALGAWSSHVEPERKDDKGRPEWPTYLPLYAKMYEYPEHVAAPHIYYSRPPKSAENMDGFKYLVDLFAYVERMMTAPIPFEVVITEYGRLANPTSTWLDPDKGYGLEGISETDYADELAILASRYPKWKFVTFSRGAWGTRGSLGVGKDYEARMEQYASGELLLPQAPVEPEPEDSGWVVAVAKIGKLPDGKPDGLRIRSARSTASEHVASILDGEDCRYRLDPVKAGNYWWVSVINRHGVKGYAAVLKAPLDIAATAVKPYLEAQFVPPPAVEPDPKPEPEPPTEPEPPDIPNDAPATVHDLDKLRTDMTAYSDAKYDALLAEIAMLKQLIVDIVGDYGDAQVKVLKRVEKLPKIA